MTTEDALLAAVCDRLDDSLPRLVLADWLDEHGRPDEAAAWRATADKVPEFFKGYNVWSWQMSDIKWSFHLSLSLFERLTGKRFAGVYRDYPTARAALLDLIAAWVAVERGKERVCGRCNGDGSEQCVCGTCHACSGSGKAVAGAGGAVTAEGKE